MNISVAILAGGMSRRFGADKTLALLGDRPLIQWVAAGAANISNDVMVIAKDSAKYQFLSNVRHVADVYEQQCAMVGIITGLEAAHYDATLVISADTPLFPFEAVSDMASIAGDAIVPEIAGKQYPCAAIYRKSILPSIKAQYAAQDYRLMNLFKSIAVAYPTEMLFRKYAEPERAFINVNTQEDLAKILPHGNMR